METWPIIGLLVTWLPASMSWVRAEPVRRMLERLLGRGGQVLVIVDQPASIGALPVAVARQLGLQVALTV